jgi:two-component system, OmpR family, alkaline phosphatase synthesis response regulator PhoP
MPRVLIADDNPQNAELLDAHLDGTGYETKIAANGEDALAQTKAWLPDVVLLDVMMPKLSGFEVCKRLKADPATAKTAVLMVTALDQPTDVARAIDAGTDDFLTKPINKSELVLRVKSLVEASGEPTEVDRALAYMRRVQQGL